MSEFKFLEKGSVTSPLGFKAAGVVAGFKRSGAPDFAMIYSEKPANFAAAFTSCVFAAAPVLLGRERVAGSAFLRAAAINSGNANACTGKPGLADARKSCEMVANALNISPDEVIVSSTGRIGVPMPMDVEARGVELAVEALSGRGGEDAARAIMTTDTVPKSRAVELHIGGKKVTIGAMTKGAGMINPELKVPHATMLCYVTCDARVDNALLREMLAENVEKSFNRITVDGDMSTNDTVVVMANGCSGVEIRSKTPEAELFKRALLAVMTDLALSMVRDGEGATKFVRVEVAGCATAAEARKFAEAVANSLLCKTAWFGNDPNWGRVVAALGYAGVDFNPDLVDVYFGGLPVVKSGGNAGTPESVLVEAVKGDEFVIRVEMNCGDAEYWVATSDLSYEYVKINADYHT